MFSPNDLKAKKTGKSGYQPVCSNEWVQNVYRKPAITCASCDQRAFQKVSDEAIRNHLAGEIPFDKEQWELDVRSYLETCRKEQVPASLERSRSGNGGHIWIFFEHPIQASKAMLAYNTGILSATTAFGKTVVALSIIAERKVNTLILVHRKQLMDQWVERITQFLDIPKNQIGQFGGTKKRRRK